MALPRNYEYKISIKTESEEQKQLRNSFRGKLLHELKQLQATEIQENKKKIQFVIKNTLFGIAVKVQMRWSYAPQFNLYIRFDMSEFMKFLIAFALFIGFLGRITIQHYIIITLSLSILLYLLNFAIIYVWSNKFSEKILYSIIPNYFEKREMQKRSEKYSDIPQNYSQKSVSREGNFTINYQIKKENEKNKR